MARRFNYTGRKKINQGDVFVRIDGSGPTLRFDATLKLGDYKLAPNGRIFVEAYRGNTASWKRFDFGQINAPILPVTGSLAEFKDPGGILFRVKVTVEDNGIGRLLAKAEKIKPSAPGDDRNPAKSLLDTRTQELHGEAWRLDFTDGRPLLLVDPRVGGKEFAREPQFRALVAPAMFRQILTEYVMIDEAAIEDDDPDDVRNRWIHFAERTAKISFPGFDGVDEEDRREWIDSAVSAFASNAQVVDRFEQSLRAEGAP